MQIVVEEETQFLREAHLLALVREHFSRCQLPVFAIDSATVKTQQCVSTCNRNVPQSGNEDEKIATNTYSHDAVERIGMKLNRDIVHSHSGPM